MKKMINKSLIEGTLYESTLEEKQMIREGQEVNYVAGKLSVEITEDNVISVDIFENEITRAGKRNQKYDKLLSLIDANSIVSSGRESAVCLRIDSALSLNDWYPNGQDELVSSIRNFNGFINFKSAGEVQPQATFQADMLITSTQKDMSKDENGDFVPNGRLRLKGHIFDFAERILPVEFIVASESGVSYFQDIEENTFTKVWGRQVTETTTTRKVEESAFGDDRVVEYTNTKSELIVTGTNKEPYLFGEEGILTVQEVQDAIASRKVYLADKKSQSQQSATTTSSAPKTTVNEDLSKTQFDF